MQTNGKYGNLDNIIHRTESSDWVAAVLGLEKHPIMSMLSGHGDRYQNRKERNVIYTRSSFVVVLNLMD